MPDPTDLAQKPKRVERCPYCGADINAEGCDDPNKCEREIADEERAEMERRIEDIRSEYGYH